MSISATLDMSRLLDINAIVEVLDSLDPSYFEGLIDFDEFECPFESLEVSPKRRKFIQTLSIIGIVKKW